MKKQILVGAFSSLILAACGGGGGDSSSSSPPQTPEPPHTQVNQKPVAQIQGSNSILRLQSLKLDASASYDPEGELISYQWRVASYPSAATYSLSQDNTVTPTFRADTVGEYTIQLVVNDGKLDSTVAELRVVVKASDTTPQAIVNGWYKPEVKVSEEVFLQSLSKDEDGDRITHVWTLKQKPAQSRLVLLPSEHGASVAHFKPDVEGRYVLELRVTDPQGNSDQVDVSIDAVIGNSKPVAKIKADTQTTVYKSVNLSGYESLDYDNDPLKGIWRLVSKPTGSFPQLFGTNEYNKSLFTTFTPDKAGQYVIEFIVNDGKVDSLPARHVIDVENLGLVFHKVNYFPNETFQWPYLSVNNQYNVHYQCAYDKCDTWAYELSAFTFDATDRDYHIVDLECYADRQVTSIYGASEPTCMLDFGSAPKSGNGYLIPRQGQSAVELLKLHALADKHLPVTYTFKFKVLETGDTFEYRAKISVL